VYGKWLCTVVAVHCYDDNKMLTNMSTVPNSCIRTCAGLLEGKLI